MPKKRKRRSPRKPLTDSQEAAGVIYYTRAQYDKIFRYIPLHPKASRQYLEEQIDIVANEYCVGWHDETKHAQKGDWPPSEAEKYFKEFVNLLSSTRKKLADLPKLELEEFKTVAEGLALDGEVLPGLKSKYSKLSKKQLYFNIIDEEIENIQDGLKWLEIVADKTATKAEEEKDQSGNRPDLEEYRFVNDLIDIYKKATGTDIIKRPKYNRGTGRWRDAGLLQYIQACQAPLGTRRTPGATFQLLKRSGAIK